MTSVHRSLLSSEKQQYHGPKCTCFEISDKRIGARTHNWEVVVKGTGRKKGKEIGIILWRRDNDE